MRIGCVSVVLANIIYLLDGLELPFPELRASDSHVFLAFQQIRDIDSMFLQVKLIADDCEVNRYVHHDNNDRLSLKVLNFNKPINPGAKVRVQALVESKKTIKKLNAVYTINSASVGQIDVAPPNATCKPAEGLSSTCDKLIFEDNFNNDQILSEKWVHEVRYRNNDPYLEFVAFVSDPSNSNITDNELHITMTAGSKQGRVPLDGCTGTGTNNNADLECGSDNNLIHSSGHFTKRSANLYSKFTFKYGRIEIRAQMPRGDWIFPNILLEPKSEQNPKSRPKDQIRLYSRGNEVLQNKDLLYFDGRSLFGGVVVWHEKHNVWTPSEYWTARESKGLQFWREPHNYTIIWQENIITFKVNGVHFGDITNRALLERFNADECHIVLGLTAGGRLNFDDEVLLEEHKILTNINNPEPEQHFIDNFNKTISTPLIVDYIRVYELDDC